MDYGKLFRLACEYILDNEGCIERANGVCQNKDREKCIHCIAKYIEKLGQLPND